MQKVKEEVGITESVELDYKVKIGLVATVADYVQMPHLDCGMHANTHSWIFHVPICKHGMYLYIWDVDAPGLKKNWCIFLLGVFWCYAMMCGMVESLVERAMSESTVVFLRPERTEC